MSGWPGQVGRILGAALARFGEPVTFLPAGGSSSQVTGIFTAASKQVDPNTGVVVSTNEPILGVRLSDFTPLPGLGSKVIVRGITYRVMDCQEDGEGGAKLYLQRV